MELLGPSHTILVWGIVCPSLFVCQMRKKRREKEKKMESLGVRLSTFVSFYPHTHTHKKKEKRRENVDRDTKPRPTNEPVTLYFYIRIKGRYIYTQHRI
jgi:hypothetical protein